MAFNRIEPFPDGMKLETVRTFHLNPTIEKTNELARTTDDFLNRVGKFPLQINHIDAIEPTGWYYVTPSQAGGRGEGVVQYYTHATIDGRALRIQQIHYPFTAGHYIGTRDWDASRTEPRWSLWKEVGGPRSGFVMEPNPPVFMDNYFKSTTEYTTKQQRDVYMSTHSLIFDKYKANSMLLILLEWPDSSVAGGKVIVYQNWLNGEWIDTFGHFAGILDFGKHSLNELKDGSRIKNLEDQTITGVICDGLSTDVDLCDGLVSERKLHISKLRPTTSKYLNIARDDQNKAVMIGANPTWRGEFETKEAAEAVIPAEQRLVNETMFSAKGSASARTTYSQYYLWDGNNFVPHTPLSKVLVETSKGEKIAPNLIKPGLKMEFTGYDTSTGEVHLDCLAVETKFMKQGSSTKTSIKEITAGTNIYMNMDANDKLTINATVPDDIIQVEMGDMNKPVHLLKKGSEIDFQYTESGQVLTINAAVPKTQFELSGVQKELKILKSSSKYVQEDAAQGKYTLPVSSAYGANGADKGEFVNIKEGDGITITNDTSTGTATISATASNVTVSDKDETQSKPLKKIVLRKKDVMTDDKVVLQDLVAKNSTGANMGEVAYIQEDVGVHFTMASDGGIKIKSDIVSAKVGDATGYSEINQIQVANKYAEIAGKVLKLPVISAENENGASLGQIKNIKQGGNVVFNMSNEGVLTVASTGGGGSSIKADINDGINFTLNTLSIYDNAIGKTSKTDDGGLKIYTQPTVGAKINGSTGDPKLLKSITIHNRSSAASTVGEDGAIDIHIPDASGGGGSGKIVVAGKDSAGAEQTYQEVSQVSFEGATISQDSGTKIVTVTSSAGAQVQAKCPSQTEYTTVEKFNIEGDDKLSSIDTTTKTLTLKVDKTIPVYQNKTLLETAYPATTSSGMLAIISKVNDGDVVKNFLMYCDGTSWDKYSYKNMPRVVDSLNKRYPELVNEKAAYIESSSIRSTNYAYAAKDESGTSNPLPIGKKENCIVHTVANKWGAQSSDPKVYAQMIYGLENGTVWFRHHNESSTKPSGVTQIAGLSDKHFTIFTPWSSCTYKTIKDGNKIVPLHIVQDNQCNMNEPETPNGKFQITTGGLYNGTLCVTLSNINVTSAGKEYTVTGTIKWGTGSSSEKQDATLKVVSKIFGENYYSTPAVLLTFPNISIPEDSEVWVELTITGPDGDNALDAAEVDPYKNYFVLEPSTSLTKTGARIARTLRNTLGGMSFQEGTEVRVQTGSTIKGIRVFGAYYDGTEVVK